MSAPIPRANGYRSVARSLAVLVLGMTVVRAAAAADAGEPTGLWQRSLTVQRFSDLTSEATLTTTFASGDQVVHRLRLLAILEADGVSRRALTRVTSNGALRDSAYLAVEHPRAADDLWIFLPAVGSPRRLVSSNLGDSYLGSEFRYGDLVQPEPEDYLVTLRGEETVGDERCWVLEVAPRATQLARDSGLARQVLWLRTSNLVERQIEQYDRRGTLLKVIEIPRLFTDAATGKIFGLERRVRNVQSGATSTVVFENVHVNGGLSRDLFSAIRLADRSW